MARDGAPAPARVGAAALVAAAVALCATLMQQQQVNGARDVARQAAAAQRLVDLNRATPEELALLPGIGPAIAGRIVSERSERGPFASVDELRRVKGIGAATLERVRPFATAGQST